MKRLFAAFAMSVLMMFALDTAFAQEAPAAAAPAANTAAPEAADGATPAPAAGQKPGMGFIDVILSSGWLGVVLWLALFGAGGAGAYFIVDCWLMVQVKRVLPDGLIRNVTESMQEGDVLKALKYCEDNPGPLGNILSAGFSHVEEGFDVIQDSIATAADLETERMMQKLAWISVCANLAPMLGLLGTVQGMIYAFANLSGGAPDIGILAMNIAQALYTTAAGLCTAIPCITFFYALRNKANTLILRMEAMTMELIKGLRNVEVVQE